MSLDQINRADTARATHLFRQCCTAERWVQDMVASRPYNSAAQLRSAADDHWRGLQEADYLQAFDGHPKIGDVSSLKARYADTKALAAGEQSGVQRASDEIIRRLADGNLRYEQKFGFIFIVCATGRSAEQMSELLEARLPNDRPTELLNAAEEQRKIFQIRLNQLLERPA